MNIKFYIILKRIVIFTILFLNLGNISFCQTDTLSASKLYFEISKSHKALPSEYTISNTIKAAGIYKKYKCWKRVYDCQKLLYQIGSANGNYKEVFNHIVSIHKVFPSIEKKMRGQSFYLMGYIEDRLGNVYSSLDYYKEALKLFESIDEKKFIRNTYNNIGILEIKLRNYENAINSLSYAISLSSYINDVEELARNYKNLGLAYLYYNRVTEAKTMLDKSNVLKRNFTGEYELNISKIKYYNKEFEAALMFANQALAKARNFNKTVKNRSDNINIAYYLSNIGEIKLAQNQYEVAIQYFLQAYQLHQSIEDKREIVKILLPLSSAYLAKGNYDLAIIYLDKCIQILDPKNRIIYGNKIIASHFFIEGDMYLIDVLKEKGKCYLAKHKVTRKISDIEEANKFFELGTDLVNTVKQKQTDIMAKSEMAKSTKSIFELSIKTKLTLFETTKKNRYLEQAFISAQKHNVFTLREKSSERDQINLSVKKAGQKERYFQLQNDYLNAAYQLKSNYSEAAFIEYDQKKKVFDVYKDSLYSLYPALKRLNKDQNVIAYEKIKMALKEKELLINYFSGENQIIAFYMDKKSLKYFLIENNADLRTSIFNFYQHLSYSQAHNNPNDKHAFDSVSHFLYKKLLKPIIGNSSEKYNKLIIVPDEHLFKLPFEALLVNTSPNVVPSSKYLIGHYIVNYQYFCGQILDENSKNNSSFLGIGLEYDKYTLETMKSLKKDSIPDWIIGDLRSGELSHLYFADDEVNDITKLFGGRAFTNEKATKQNFLNFIKKSGIIHISAHSCVDFDDYGKSVIIFSKSKYNSDNLLSYNEVLGYNLNAQLVTLSACNTSIGKLEAGEGVHSFAKAFYSAGSKSILGSYWSIPDEVSKLFMNIFYEKIKAGKPKDIALRETKLEFINNDNLVNPFFQTPSYWSCWVLYGNVDAIQVNNNFSSYLLILGFGLILLSLIVWKRNRIFRMKRKH